MSSIQTTVERKDLPEEYLEMMKTETHHNHEIIQDKYGTLRWKADPKWWDSQVIDGYKFCYWNNEDGYHHFTIVPRPECELLAKRPEPEWVPEVGEWCMRGEKGSKYSYKVFMIGYNSEGFPVFESLPHHDSITCDTGYYEYKPIKTQREELIDIIAETYMNANSQRTIADAILARFDLTEKEGE